MADALNGTGYQQLTVSTAALALTFPTATGKTQPRRCLMTVENQPIRWRADGTNPTSTVGMPAAPGTTLDFTWTETDYNGFMQTFRVIRDTTAASDATLNIHYFS